MRSSRPTKEQPEEEEGEELAVVEGVALEVVAAENPEAQELEDAQGAEAGVLRPKEAPGPGPEAVPGVLEEDLQAQAEA